MNIPVDAAISFFAARGHWQVRLNPVLQSGTPEKRPLSGGYHRMPFTLNAA